MAGSVDRPFRPLAASGSSTRTLGIWIYPRPEPTSASTNDQDRTPGRLDPSSRETGGPRSTTHDTDLSGLGGARISEVFKGNTRAAARAERRFEELRRLSALADIVCAVGPRLQRKVGAMLADDGYGGKPVLADLILD